LLEWIYQGVRVGGCHFDPFEYRAATRPRQPRVKLSEPDLARPCTDRSIPPWVFRASAFGRFSSASAFSRFACASSDASRLPQIPEEEHVFQRRTLLIDSRSQCLSVQDPFRQKTPGGSELDPRERPGMFWLDLRKSYERSKS